MTAQVDVRDRAALKKAFDDAVAELGGLDVVVANAAIMPLGEHIPRKDSSTPSTSTSSA